MIDGSHVGVTPKAASSSSGSGRDGKAPDAKKAKYAKAQEVSCAFGVLAAL